LIFLLKGWGLKDSSTHQGCFYLITNTVKTVILFVSVFIKCKESFREGIQMMVILFLTHTISGRRITTDWGI